LFNRAVFWFHPLAWWLSRRLSALAEEACDDAVLAGGHDPEEYTECLLGLARSVRESGARVSALGMAMPGSYLPQRIRRIVAGAPAQRISRGRMISVAVVCAAVSGVFTTCAIGYSHDAVVPVRSVPTVDAAPPAPVPTRRKVLVAQNIVPAPRTATSQTLSGVIEDPNGAVVPNAPVALVNSDTKISISTTADQVGRFTFQNIDPGTYSVTVKTPGFKSLMQTDIHVAAGEAHNAGTMMLQLGSVSESISVVGSRSAPVTPTGTVGIPVGDTTALTSKAAAPVGIPLEQTVVRPADNSGAARPIKVGGNVVAANLINPIKPAYPPELQRAGVQGTVRIEAFISKDGLAANLRVISSPDPGLTQAALDAVQQWRYRPTVLNGESVEVQTTIDVNFSLSD
jgi:TonB family protein